MAAQGYSYPFDFDFDFDFDLDFNVFAEPMNSNDMLEASSFPLLADCPLADLTKVRSRMIV